MGSHVLANIPNTLSSSYNILSHTKQKRMVGKLGSTLPPGFRFHPTDEELIMYYLRFQATSTPCPISIIPEVDIYKFDPWELPDKAEFGEKEWYFFTPRDRKYPNGLRPNRAAVSGYWKATGTDKAIHSGSKYVGIKKALVFYEGRPPKGVKTDWIMHEYRLSESRSQPYKKNGSMRLDDWVLCRIYKKKCLGKANSNNQQIVFTHEDLSFAHQVTTTTVTTSGDHRPGDQPQQLYSKFPRIASLTHLWEFDYMGSISNLINESCYNNSLYQEIDMNHDHKNQLPCTDGVYLQQSYVNPTYGLQ